MVNKPILNALNFNKIYIYHLSNGIEEEKYHEHQSRCRDANTKMFLL